MEQVNTPTYFLKRLTAEDDVQSFDCGSDEWEIEVSNFLKEDALDQQGQRLNVTWLYYLDDQLAGFMSLTASDIKVRIGLMEQFGLRESKYPDMPCLLIGRLGVSQSVKRHGIGQRMVNWVYGTALNNNFGIKFLTIHVDKRNKGGRAFWESQKFEEYSRDSRGPKTCMLYHLRPESS